MKNVKKILSLVLVLVLAMGCLVMSASATEIDPDDVFEGFYPSIKGIEFIVNSTTYPGNLVVDPVEDTADYQAFIPETIANLSSASVRVTAGNIDAKEEAKQAQKELQRRLKPTITTC